MRLHRAVVIDGVVIQALKSLGCFRSEVQAIPFVLGRSASFAG
jgi:hypothetical protein